MQQQQQLPSNVAAAGHTRTGLTGAIGPRGRCQQVAMWPVALPPSPGPGQELGAWGMGHPHLGVPRLSWEPPPCPRVFGGWFRIRVLLMPVGEQDRAGRGVRGLLGGR